MDFKKYFNKEKIIESEGEIIENKIDFDNILEKIRKEFKIKQIIPTKFGIEVKFFNVDDAKSASKIAKTSKIDGNSIFMD